MLALVKLNYMRETPKAQSTRQIVRLAVKIFWDVLMDNPQGRPRCTRNPQRLYVQG